MPDAHSARCYQAVNTRRAGPGDARTLAATLAEAFDSYREWAPSGWAPPTQSAEATEALAEALSRPDVWCLLAESQDEPVGHVALSLKTVVQPESPPRGTVNLWQLFVSTTWQGFGVAPRLMRSALAEADRRGFARLRLWTPRGAARARRFYEREGWTLTGNERSESPLGFPIIEYGTRLSTTARVNRQPIDNQTTSAADRRGRKKRRGTVPLHCGSPLSRPPRQEKPLVL